MSVFSVDFGVKGTTLRVSDRPPKPADRGKLFESKPGTLQCCCWVDGEKGFARCPMEAIPNPRGMLIGGGDQEHAKASFCAGHFSLFEDYCAAYHDVSRIPKDGESIEERLERSDLSELKDELDFREYVHAWWFRDPDLPEDAGHVRTMELLREEISKRRSQTRARVDDPQSPGGGEAPVNMYAVLPVSRGKKEKKMERGETSVPNFESPSASRDIEKIKIEIAQRAWDDMCQDVLDPNKSLNYKQDRGFMADKIESNEDFDVFVSIYDRIDSVYSFIKLVTSVCLEYQECDSDEFYERCRNLCTSLPFAVFASACRELSQNVISFSEETDDKTSRALLDAFFKAVRERPNPEPKETYNHYFWDHPFFMVLYPCFPSDVFLGSVGDSTPFITRLATLADFPTSVVEGAVFYIVYMFCRKGVRLETYPNRVKDITRDGVKDRYIPSLYHPNLTHLKNIEENIQKLVSFRATGLIHTRQRSKFKQDDVFDTGIASFVYNEKVCLFAETERKYRRWSENIIKRLHTSDPITKPDTTFFEHYSRWIVDTHTPGLLGIAHMTHGNFVRARYILGLQKIIATDFDYDVQKMVETVNKEGDGYLASFCSKHGIHPEYIRTTTFTYSEALHETDRQFFVLSLLRLHSSHHLEELFFANDPQVFTMAGCGNHKVLLLKPRLYNPFQVICTLLVWHSKRFTIRDVHDLVIEPCPDLAEWMPPRLLAWDEREEIFDRYRRKGGYINHEGDPTIDSTPDGIAMNICKFTHSDMWNNLANKKKTEEYANVIEKCYCVEIVLKYVRDVLRVSKIVRSVLKWYKSHPDAKPAEIENPLLASCYFLVKPIDRATITESTDMFSLWLLPEISKDIDKIFDNTYAPFDFTEHDADTLAAIFLLQHVNGKPLPDVESEDDVEMPERRVEQAKLDEAKSTRTAMECIDSALLAIAEAHKNAPLEELMQVLSLLEKCKERLSKGTELRPS